MGSRRQNAHLNSLQTKGLLLGTRLEVNEDVTRANGAADTRGRKGREAAMKPKDVSKGILIGLVFSLLSASVSMGAGAEGNVTMSRIERAGSVQSQQTASRRNEPFRSGKTDSWLCNNVSSFFCANLFPTLSSPDAPKSPSTPARGRK
jgi:hypothetical protein